MGLEIRDFYQRRNFIAHASPQYTALTALSTTSCAHAPPHLASPRLYQRSGLSRLTLCCPHGLISDLGSHAPHCTAPTALFTQPHRLGCRPFVCSPGISFPAEVLLALLVNFFLRISRAAWQIFSANEKSFRTQFEVMAAYSDQEIKIKEKSIYLEILQLCFKSPYRDWLLSNKIPFVIVCRS